MTRCCVARAWVTGIPFPQPMSKIVVHGIEGTGCVDRLNIRAVELIKELPELQEAWLSREGLGGTTWCIEPVSLLDSGVTHHACAAQNHDRAAQHRKLRAQLVK